MPITDVQRTRETEDDTPSYATLGHICKTPTRPLDRTNGLVCSDENMGEMQGEATAAKQTRNVSTTETQGPCLDSDSDCYKNIHSR